MKLPERVTIVEVGPRDGLQNEAGEIPLAVKIGLIDRLSATGLGVIEAGSFVSAKWVPQMADTAQVMAGITRKASVRYSVLVPNHTGLSAAMTADTTEIAVFASASESFSQKNCNVTMKANLENYRGVVQSALKSGIRVRGYVSCALGCPYEGDIALQDVRETAFALHEMGCYQISLADTIGIGTPLKAREMIKTVAQQVPRGSLAVHFHDTYGQALANIYAALEEGVTVIDSSVAGLGGCPFAKGASGNVASEDLLYMLNGLGIETGVNLTALISAGRYISDFLGRTSASKVAIALL